MPNQEPQLNHQSERPGADYRGTLVYHQEQGYTFITIMISLRSFDEKSRVMSRAYDLDILEEAEHIPSTFPPFTAVDIYRFPVTDGTKIELTLSSQAGESNAYYTVHADRVEEDSPSLLWLDIGEHEVQSSSSPNHSSDR